MFTRRVVGLSVACVVTVGLGVAALMAMDPPKGGTAKAPDAKPMTPANQEVRVVTLEGRIVDLQCHMTQKFATSDHTKCTADCIRAGVPAALETKTGLVIIGEGNMGPGAKLAPFALENAKVTGKLYEHDGLKYIDMTKIEKAATQTHAAANPLRKAPLKKASIHGKPASAQR